MKKLIIMLVTAILVLTGCGASVYEAQATYTVPEVPAVEGGEITYETKLSGTYIIGSSPSEYVTGNETEFTTAQSGKYIAGEDFPAGTYDLVAVEGSGNVFSSGNSINLMGLNQIMGVEEDDFYVSTYDNYTFEEGEELEVSGVSIKLVPQTDDTFVIEPGEYDLEAIKGNGNVFTNGNGMGLNEMMGVDDDEFYVKKYENYEFIDGEVLEVSSVSLKLVGELPPTEKVDAYDVTETLRVETATAEGEQSEFCTTDVSGSEEEVDCSELKEYDTLKADVDAQMAE